ncbi:hypothetical protein EIP91_001468 [Steccherinum ochraceum]|uniref:Uncharacterized protein n=1 Tax=Steccherinum ochraceum TaxID=92696 RepID=A0A4R0RGJ7_9APHY|nr:hypothetical protein EIP91_001468 [Steccherinum ochraceum]
MTSLLTFAFEVSTFQVVPSSRFLSRCPVAPDTTPQDKMRFTIAVAVLATLPFVASFVINDELLSFCKSPILAQQSYIGDVMLSTIQCANLMPSGVYKRQNANVSNVCGAECDTHCFNPSGGGPDPNDCNVIADALRYDSQDISEEFNITTSNALFVLQYHSCQSFFVNQAGTTDLTYCRSDWAAVIDYVAFNCQAPQNAHGGLCLAATQQWFIQVQPFVNASASSPASTSTPTTSATTSTPLVPITTPSLPSTITSSIASSTSVNSTVSSTPVSTTTSSSIVTTPSSASSSPTTTASSTETSSSSSSGSVPVTVSTTTSASVSTETSVSTSTSASSSSTSTSTATETSVSTTTTSSVATTTSSA